MPGAPALRGGEFARVDKPVTPASALLASPATGTIPGRGLWGDLAALPPKQRRAWRRGSPKLARRKRECPGRRGALGKAKAADPCFIRGKAHGHSPAFTSFFTFRLIRSRFNALMCLM